MKKGLCKTANLSPSLVAKLGRNENMTTDVLAPICKALDCDVGDIMEMIPDNRGRLKIYSRIFGALMKNKKITRTHKENFFRKQIINGYIYNFCK